MLLCEVLSEKFNVDTLRNKPTLIYFPAISFFTAGRMILTEKYKISTPLMMENPVRSPMVPPMTDNLSTNVADLSFVILSNVVASK